MKFKSDKVKSEWAGIKPKLAQILMDADEFCTRHGEELMITDLLSDAFEDARIGRVSISHQEGRAADVRNKWWTPEFNASFIKWLEETHGKSGAISKSDGKRRIVVDHVGTARHLHIQIAKEA